MPKKVLRYAGFAEESEYDVDPAPAAAFHVDIASAGLDAPSDPQVVYGGGLSRNARTHRPGWYAPSGNVVHATDVHTIGWLLKWALGGYVFTDGGVGLNTHELYGTDDVILPSFCTRLGKDQFEHVFSGCCVGQLQLQTSNEFVQVTADVVAARDAKAALAAVENLLLPDAYPLMFHEVTYGLAGADVSARVRSMTLTIANNPSNDGGRGGGSRHPQRQLMGERVVTLQLGLYYDDTEQLERFWGGAAGPADTGAVEYAAALTLDAGADGQLVLDMPRAIHTQVATQPSGRDELEQTVNARAFVDTAMLADGVTEVQTDLVGTLTNDIAEMALA